MKKMRTERPLRVAIYYRFSSDKNAQKENSEKRQKSELEREAIKLGWVVVWSDGDRETSGDAHKPKLTELRALVESGELTIDCVYVSSWDRLTRKDSLEFSSDVGWIRDAGASIALKNKGSQVIDLKDNQELLLLQMEVYAANQYLKDLSCKVNSGLTSRFNRGNLGYARAPFGFDKDGQDGIVTNSDIELVPKMFDQVLEGGIVSCIPLMKLGQKYQANGKTPVTSAVKTVLRNAIYIGQRTFGVAGTGKHSTIRGEKTTGTRNVNRLAEAALSQDVSETIEPVVDEQTFHKVQQLLDSNQKERPRRKDTKYKYSGMIRCANCGAKLVAEQKVRHVNYVCPKSKNSKLGCPGRKTLTELQISDMLAETSAVIGKVSSFHDHIFDIAVNAIRRGKMKSSNQNHSALDRLAAKKTRLGKLQRLYVEGTGENEEQAFTMLQELQTEIAKEEKEIRAIASEHVDIDEILYRRTMLDRCVDGESLMERYELSALVHASAFVEDGKEIHRKRFRQEVSKLSERNNFPVRAKLDGLKVKFRKLDGKRFRPTLFTGSVRGTNDSLGNHVRIHGTD